MVKELFIETTQLAKDMAFWKAHNAKKPLRKFDYLFNKTDRACNKLLNFFVAF